MLLKPLSGTQTFLAMVGYITKDFGKAHYQVVVKNISAQHLGRRNSLFYM